MVPVWRELTTTQVVSIALNPYLPSHHIPFFTPSATMVYTMVMYVDGGCRNNGYSNAFGAAAVVIKQRWGRSHTWTRALPKYPRATSQRAELEAIILALEQAQERAAEMDNAPFMKVTIHTDSKYAHGCMTDWSFKWRENGWINSAGNEVANRDLVEKAVDLDNAIEENGSVSYTWISRSENQEADNAVNERLDEIEDG